MNKLNGRNEQIQFIRGLGCISILFYHYYCRYDEIYLNMYKHSLFVRNMGKMGVVLFLVIMGYYLVPTKGNNAMKYIQRRLKKLFLPYLIIVIVIYISSFSGYLGTDREVTFSQFILNVFMINGFVNSPYVDGAHWYMTYTLVFIFIMFFILLIKKQNSKYTYIIWILISFTLGIFNLFIDSSIIQELKLLTGGIYTPVVINGIILKKLYEDEFTIKEYWLIFTLCFVTSVVISGFIFALLMLFNIIIIYFITTKKIQFLLKFKGIIYIGNMSYMIYLLHQNIGYMIINFILSNSNNNISNNIIITNIIKLIIPTIIILIACILINKINDFLIRKFSGRLLWRKCH